MLNRLFRRPAPAKAPPRVEDGRRIYAIGDIHGRLDLFDAMLERVEEDLRERPAADPEIILLGDLIDRGPDSAGVIRRAMAPPPWARLRALKGNHEASMLAALDGDLRMMRTWLRYGGAAALESWGMDPDLIANAPLPEVIEAARKLIPVDERRWLIRLPLSMRSGDYYFAHAGLRPGVDLAAQAEEDTLWIREEFLDSRRDHGAVVIHGHSISEDVQERDNRIGIDTGAYKSGRLTAIALEGAERWFLQT